MAVSDQLNVSGPSGILHDALVPLGGARVGVGVGVGVFVGVGVGVEVG